jgi:hypothetical protein
LTSILDVVPAALGATVSLSAFKLKDKKALRQLRDIGEATGVFRVGDTVVEPGPLLEDLLRSLDARDYIAVNGLFREVPAYDLVLREAEASGAYPSTKTGGAATGWAVVLGAAFKTKSGARYGLDPVPAETFEEAVRRAHAEVGQGDAAVPLPKILDRVCVTLRLSPIRFEAMLCESLSSGSLVDYEAQRATVQFDLPEHIVLVAPGSAEVGHFLRRMVPGRGVLVGGNLVSSLVRRGGGS